MMKSRTNLGQILKGEMKAFFVQYNDPVYVQVEKIESMIMLASNDNIDVVLGELTETTEKVFYQQLIILKGRLTNELQVDTQLVKMAIRAIARCAIKLDAAADKCVKILTDIITNQDFAAAQEAIAVLKGIIRSDKSSFAYCNIDIYRRYPGKFEPKTMSAVTAHIKNLDEMEPGPKSALVWILGTIFFGVPRFLLCFSGEYSNSIDEAPKALDLLMTTFKDEAVKVQLNLLTSMVKLFLKKPSPETRKMVETSLGKGNGDVAEFIHFRHCYKGNR